jgi:curved DNA-binding protein CbpA
MHDRRAARRRTGYHAPEPMNPRILPYSPERDVYRLLGVAPSASTDEIAAACRRLARTFHPDRNRSMRATQEMQIVNAVRQVMTDPRSREAYDRERWRFHAGLTRSSDRRPTLRPAPAVLPASPAPWERYLLAARAGVRALLLELAPPRCRSCRIVVEREDAYCAACGTPRLTGGARAA